MCWRRHVGGRVRISFEVDREETGYSTVESKCYLGWRLDAGRIALGVEDML